MKPYRAFLGAVFVALSAAIVFVTFYPTVRDLDRCDTSVPKNAAQTAAISDARSRTNAVCAAINRHCQFVIGDKTAETFSVSTYFSEVRFPDGCVFDGQHIEVLIYDHAGKYLRTEEAPYG